MTLQLRDALIAVALYFAACALVTDAQAATRKDFTMDTPATAWRPHTEQPTTQVKALIRIKPYHGEPTLLSEIHFWEHHEGYWISASSHLKIRHTEFDWLDIRPLLAAPAAWMRDEEATEGLLWNARVNVTAETIATWTDEQIKQAEDYSAAYYMWKHGTAIAPPPMPRFLRELQGATS